MSVHLRDDRDQARVIAFLSDPSTHGGATVECVETHISMVFIAGNSAFKLKRAVKFDYLDFSTPERRRQYCEAEVRLNRRTAPAIYQQVLPVTQNRDGSLTLGGDGRPIDWVVCMRRFDQTQLLDRLADAAALPLAVMDRLGRSIASFHAAAETRVDRGGFEGMRTVIKGNASGLEAFAGDFDAGLIARLTGATMAALEQHRDLLEERRQSGYVRACHGDLHLGNIVLLDGVPTLFDAIEFNDDISSCDVLYDLAFTLMDVNHRRLRRHANVMWNAYLEESAEYGGLRLMPLFLSCRAAVRAKISAASIAVQHEASRRDALRRAAHGYAADAVHSLDSATPKALAIGGVSGTGKSTLAAALAPSIGAPPGAVVLRSDVIRKTLCAVPRGTRLEPSAYSPEVSARVYATLAERLQRVLRERHSVIVDATFLRAENRRLIESAAAAVGVTLHGYWLDAPDDVLIDRLRRRTGDASDADEFVLAKQRATSIGEIRWNLVSGENQPDIGKFPTEN